MLNSQTNTSLQPTDFTEVDHLVNTIDQIPIDSESSRADASQNSANEDFTETISLVIDELNKRQLGLGCLYPLF